MSSTVSKIDFTNLNKPKPMTADIVIGKDVLELLAAAMYADPLTVFREYVQNAADSIDLARQTMPDSEAFGVTITLDRTARSILIRDNGASIPLKRFEKQLTSIGASEKRGKGSRGFRGVGRLSGLGYCQELLFRGRAEGEPKVMELRWDGRRLREQLRNATYEGDLADLVRSVVEVRQLSGENYPERFFEVELRKVTRLRGDMLLNEEVVRTYLSQVAPVPFHPEFKFGAEISEYLAKRNVPAPIDIRLLGDANPIYHRASNDIPFNDRLVDKIQSVEYIELLGQEGEVDAFGWLLDHAYLGSIPRRLQMGGIRLRAGNLQVGGEGLLSSLFNEPRFAGWSLGDIHICSPKILPNARRDDFEASVHYTNLQDQIALLAKRITSTIRDRSLMRNRMRKALLLFSTVDQWLEQTSNGQIPDAIAFKVRAIVDEKLDKARKEISKLGDTDESNALRQRLASLSMSVNALSRDESRKSGPKSASAKAIDAALGAILDYASSPQVAMTMSKRVINAFASH